LPKKRILEVTPEGVPRLSWNELDVTQLARVADALEYLATGMADVVAVNSRCEGVAELLEKAGDVPVVVVSDRPSVAEAVATMKAGAADYVPFTSAEAACLGAVAGRRPDDPEQVRLQLAATQAALVERERLAMVGQLAAGVAHEINNPSAFVVANLEELRSSLRDIRELLKATMEASVAAGDQLQLLRIQRLSDAANYPEIIPDMLGMLHESLIGMTRIRNIVQDLKGFSITDDEDRVPSDLRRLLERSIGLTQSELRFRGRLETRIERTPPVLCSPGRISQVFVHVLSFLMDLDVPRGLDRRFVVHCDTEDSWVVVRFGDTAARLDEHQLSRIWEPSPTRPDATRTGLGLAICTEIIRRHEGEIDIGQAESGLIVTVRLPTIAPASPTSFALILDEDLEDTDPLAEAAILVVDDEPSLINSLRRVLRRVRSFSAASSGRNALAQIEAGARPDIILRDLMMGDLSGADLFEILTRDHPELADRVLFITGGAFTERTRRFADAHADRVLIKPIAPEELRARLRKNLSDRS
jgi:two-component system NtrC family sensor kinase